MAVAGLREIFIKSQDSQNQYQLIKAFKQLYHESEFEVFWCEFRVLVLQPLCVFEREPAIEKTVEFVCKAVTDLALTATTDTQSAEEMEDDDMHPLLLKFFEFLLSVHNAKEKAVRFRVCQLITLMMINLGEAAKIDEVLYDQIHRCMSERLRDKHALVRVHSVLALKRLQDPSDDKCPITRAYVMLMTRDPNVEVRRICLTTVAASARSLSAIIERTRDVKETVRRTAFAVVAEKIPLRALEVEQRIKILHDGLNDRSEMVRKACANKLLQSWLVSCQGDVLELLTRLDVQSCIKTCESALNILFKESSIFDVVDQCTIIGEKALIPEDKLSPESAFYWRNLVHHIHQAGPEYDEQLDKVKPNCLHFCEYLRRVSGQLEECSDLDLMLDIEFIIQQLLQILLCMDLSDQASRRGVSDLMSHLLLNDHVGSSLVNFILPVLAQLHNKSDELVKVLAEIVSEIREPITNVEKEMPKADRRDLDKKIAGIRVTLNQLREELGECIEAQDFVRAAKLKADISNLDAERSSLLEDSTPRMEEVHTQRDDPLTMLKCLTVVCELLTSPEIHHLTPTLQTLVETQALPGMTNEEAEVRNAAVKAIGLSCLIKKEIIMHHLPLLLQASQMDTQQVRTTALKCIFDMFHVYGVEVFNEDGNDSNKTQSTIDQISSENTQSSQEIVNSSIATVNETQQDTTNKETTLDRRSGWTDMSNKIITILTSALDSESSDLRNASVEGLSKLLLAGSVQSSRLLSRLLLLWYNPVVAEEALVQTLGVFFPLFAYSSSANQEQLEEAFLPTLKTLLRAPTTSPLADVNENSVASFMLELTNAKYLAPNQKSSVDIQENPCHDSLARKLCNEILSKPDSFNVKLWLKTLNQVYISEDNITLVRDLCSMSEDMAIAITDKQSIKLLDKFSLYVRNLYAELRTESASSETQASLSQTATSESDTLTENMSSLSLHPESVAESVEAPATPAPSARRTRGSRAKPSKTPKMAAMSAHGAALKSATKSSKKTDATKTLDEIFATPAAPAPPRTLHSDCRQSRLTFENIFNSDSTPDSTPPPQSGKTLADVGKTPKTPKRPLHTIQDPTFTG